MEHPEKYNLKNQARQSILIFLFGALPMAFLMCRACFESYSTAFPVALFSGLMWLFLWKGNEFIYIETDRYISWLKTPLKRMFTGLGLMIAYSSVTVLIINYIFFVFVFDQEVDESFFSELWETVFFSITICTIIMLFFTARGFLLAWRQAAINTEKIKREQLHSRYEALKNQVNPHFLFNSLNALSSLIYDHPDKAVEFINRLSDVYRYVLDSKDKEVVPVNEEMSFVHSYLFLLESRFGNNLKVDIGDEDTDGFIPPMSLQMLIENAVNHNEISGERPLRIRIYCEGKYIYVKNILQIRAKHGESPGIGLDNIKSRYSVLSDLPVKIDESDTEFEVGLPVLTEL